MVRRSRPGGNPSVRRRRPTGLPKARLRAAARAAGTSEVTSGCKRRVRALGSNNDPHGSLSVESSPSKTRQSPSQRTAPRHVKWSHRLEHAGMRAHNLANVCSVFDPSEPVSSLRARAGPRVFPRPIREDLESRCSLASWEPRRAGQTRRGQARLVHKRSRLERRRGRR